MALEGWGFGIGRHGLKFLGIWMDLGGLPHRISQNIGWSLGIYKDLSWFIQRNTGMSPPNTGMEVQFGFGFGSIQQTSFGGMNGSGPAPSLDTDQFTQEHGTFMHYQHQEWIGNQQQHVLSRDKWSFYVKDLPASGFSSRIFAAAPGFGELKPLLWFSAFAMLRFQKSTAKLVDFTRSLAQCWVFFGTAP